MGLVLFKTWTKGTEYGIMMETSGAIALQCPVVTRKKFDQEAA